MASYRPYHSQSSFGAPQLPPPQASSEPHVSQYSKNWNLGTSDGSVAMGHRPQQPPLFQQTYNQRNNQNSTFKHDQQYTYKPPSQPESSYQPSSAAQSSAISQSQLNSAPSAYYSSSRYAQFGNPSAQDHIILPPGPPSPPPSSSLPPPQPGSLHVADPPENRNKGSATEGPFHDKGARAAPDSIVVSRRRDSVVPNNTIAPPTQKRDNKKADIPGGRVESEEERKSRKKREMEKQIREERHRKQLKESQNTVLQKTQILSSGMKGNSAAFGSRVVEKKTSTPFLSSEKIENRLKKPTTFLCKMKFRNELPDPSAQPKLISFKRDKDRFSGYAITSLEKMHKPELHIEPDLGIPLDLLDLRVYNRPGVKQPLDPEDEELLRSDDMVTPLKTNGLKIKHRPTDKGMSWLVKTQYISSLSAEATKQSLTEKQAKELRETRGGQNILENITSREGKIRAIEESFRANKLQPVHSTNNKLHPVEVLPLFPEFERFDDHQFVVATFDSAPTAESEMFSKLDESIRDEHESKAIMKSFIATGADPSRPDKFLAYMVPSPGELAKNPNDESVAYTWVREYHWDAKGEDSEDPSTYLLSLAGGEARYLPLSTKLILRKKRAKEGRSSDDMEHYPIPSSVTVKQGFPVSAVQLEDRKMASGQRNVRRRMGVVGGEEEEESRRQGREETGDGEEDMDVFSRGEEEEEEEEMSE